MSGRVGKVVLMKNGGWSNPHCNGFGATTLLETTFSFFWNDFFFFLKRLFLHELMFACGARDFIWLQRQKSLRVFLPFRAVSEAVFGSHSWWQHVPTVALSSLIGFLAKASPPRSYSYLGYLTRVFPKLRQTFFLFSRLPRLAWRWSGRSRKALKNGNSFCKIFADIAANGSPKDLLGY